VKLLPKREGECLILDVGAGPFTFLGKKCPGLGFKIIAVDPLADEYDRILDKYSVSPIVRTEKLEAEKLTSRYAPDSFDLVYARNCIDHAYSPERAILEMVSVVKRDQYVYLVHRPNEAENEGYAGLHQWNFSADQGDFVIRSKRDKVNMTQKYKSICVIECFCEAESEWLIVTIRKT